MIPSGRISLYIPPTYAWCTSEGMAALAAILIQRGQPFVFDGFCIEFKNTDGYVDSLMTDRPEIKGLRLTKRAIKQRNE